MPVGAKVWVQVCRANPFGKRADLLRGLKRTGGFRIESLDCLDRCTLCERVPFAVVNGHPVSADTCEEILAFIHGAGPLDAHRASGHGK